MGNASKKLAEKCQFLTKDEQKKIAQTFRAASRNSSKIKEEDLIVSGTLDPVLLEKLWGPLIDPRLAQYLSNFLFGPGTPRSTNCEFNRFAELYVYNVRGSPDERLNLIYNSLGQVNDGRDIDYQVLKEFCETIASTYIKIMKTSSNRASQWLDKGFLARAQFVQSLGESVAAEVMSDETQPLTCTSYQIENWLSRDTVLRHLAETVFINLYGINRKTMSELVLDNQASVPTESALIPIPEGLEAMPDYPAFIDLSHIVWLNSHLPQKLQNKWRFLFSSNIHGESFTTMAGRIMDNGPSVIIIEDKSGHIFGGFASQSWNISTNFYGDESSFLFTLAPKMRAFCSSGFNNHYQYINHHTKTLPNGIIMGGQLEFAAIFIAADPFGGGTTAESCTTYRGYKRLSKETSFKIKSLEVWGVGDKPISISDSDERDTSVLDRNPEAKALLDMAGKTRHSEGLREPPQS